MEDWIIPLVGLVSAFISSAVGFGGAMIMAPLLFFILPPPQAVMTTALLASITNLLIITEGRKKDFQKEELRRLALGTLPGMLVGIVLLQQISTSVALIVTGAVILLGVSFRLFLKEKARHIPGGVGYGIGLGSGLLATTTGLAALAPVWFVVRNIGASPMRDSLNLYYLFTGAGTFLLGLVVIEIEATMPPWWSLLAGVVAVVVGHQAGRLVFARISQNHQRYTNIDKHCRCSARCHFTGCHWPRGADVIQ